MKTIIVVIEGLLFLPLLPWVHYLWRRFSKEDLDKELEWKLVRQSIGVACCYLIAMALRPSKPASLMRRGHSQRRKLCSAAVFTF